MSAIGVDPTSAVNNDHQTAIFTLGAIYEYGHPTYGVIKVKYVRAEDADFVAGDPIYFGSADGKEGTRDVAGGSRIGSKVQGIALAATVDGNYGFIQVSGVNAVALTLNSGDFAAGEHMIGDTSNDGKVAAGTAGTDDLYVFGIALAVSSSSVLAAGAGVLYGNI